MPVLNIYARHFNKSGGTKRGSVQTPAVAPPHIVRESKLILGKCFFNYNFVYSLLVKAIMVTGALLANG